MVSPILTFASPALPWYSGEKGAVFRDPELCGWLGFLVPPACCSILPCADDCFPSLSPLPHCPCHASCLSPCLDVEVLKVERVQLIDAVLNLCTYHHPENIQLPPG